MMLSNFIPIQMKKSFIVFSLLISILQLSFSILTHAQSLSEDENQNHLGNCTSIMVGRLASSDGSVITSHTCDGIYRTWLEVYPHSHYEKGTMHPVYWGTFSMEDAGDMSKVTKRVEIPEVEETYAFLNTAYPCLNEKQLAIGETTLRGKEELRNQEGLFKIEELAKIALQRCKTAREAIALIGKLAEEYGYGDYSPECLTIADTKEVWQLEISGSGKGKPSAIWCAARIPDDHVGVSANISRISTIDFENPEMFMHSTDLKKVAKKLGYWDGNEPLKFWKVISVSRKAFDIREYYVLSTLAPSLNLSFDAEELPFSVKPEKQLSVYDVMKFFRETYEGTPWDMTRNLMVTVKKKDDQGNEIEEKVKSPIVNNWMSWDLWMLLDELKDGTFKFRYTIAQMMCSYSHVIQCRSWLPDEVGAIAWFSFDNPALSPRIPIFSGVLRLPSSFGICGQHRYRTDAAIWSFREANRLATLRWSKGKGLIESAVREFEIKATEELPMIEKRAVELISDGRRAEAQEYLTSYTNSFAFATMKKWEELKVALWSDYRIWGI
jgi:dipeptidase